MKLSHLAIIFIIIILPFSIVCRNNLNEYFLTLKEQVRLNNIVDVATQDALGTLVELNDEFQMIYLNERFDVTQTLAREAIKNFFQTLAINFNMPYIEEDTENYFSMYVPAILVIGYDGFFIYSVDDTGTSTYSYRLSPKIPYAYEENGVIVNLTLGNYIKIFANGRSYEGELKDGFIEESKIKYDEYFHAFDDDATLTLKYLPDMTNDMSVMLYALNQSGVVLPSFIIPPSQTTVDAVPLIKDYEQEEQTISRFHEKRREEIINIIVQTLQEEINSHNTYAAIMGSTYDFALPEIDGQTWRNSINDISVMSFIQGMPIGVNSFYNNYAFGASRIVKTEYYYGTGDTANDRRYHLSSCVLLETNLTNNIFINRESAAIAGYYPCTVCSP